MTVLDDGPWPFFPREALTKAGDRGVACPADLAVRSLEPGGQLSFVGVWDGTSASGMPIPAALVPVVASFPRYKPAVTLQNAGPDMEAPATVTAAFRMRPAPITPMSVGLAFDALIADQQVSAWLARIDRTRWNSSMLRYDIGEWQFAFRYDDTKVANVTLDAVTGAIVDRELP